MLSGEITIDVKWKMVGTVGARRVSSIKCITSFKKLGNGRTRKEVSEERATFLCLYYLK